ncbi:MAG: Na/Pi symporter [Candidatus Omnitrophica bacterium]|nr:Na/Pi symporter [Candidatus Omnitrophota bacterium]MBU1997100.1 Na/Pi symporter [Candidatus Omnitrophota bacterium]MBU4334417.1 Na/Pi symporter [Candidatus Omnitrophota bacterium]
MGKTILKLIFVGLLLYVFLVSIGLMGEAFKGFGKGFAENLLNTTSNPFVGLFVGILATSLVQSSSTTTSIVVGMVASGVLTVSGAIPIIFGANIGTTVTNTLVALGHISRREEFKRAIAGATVHDFFNLMCVAIFFPIELATGFLEKFATGLAGLFVDFGGLKFTSPIKIITKPTIHFLEHLHTDHLPFSNTVNYTLVFVTSFILIYIALFYIVKVMRSLVIDKTESVFNDIIGKSSLIGIAAGLIFTVFVQSSSITTSILVPMIAAGIITIETAFPITLGANIGTTATAMLASFALGNPAAVTIAFVHLLFNCLGVLFIFPIHAVRRIPIRLAQGLGELAYKNRSIAFFYVFGLFFVLPGILILISKMLN